ncbi:MAG: 2-hydroxychromene-2-carboxylate isomerase [Limisphaerales bacterium]|jgi:2-hydroxychromene-2-carboxylate isomerase
MPTQLDPLFSDSPLIVYVDVKSPYAFVAIEPTLKLEAELGIDFDWRPLTLDIPSYLGSARKKAGKVVESNRSPSQWLGIKYAYKDARRYAERQGHILKGTEKIWDSSIVNIGILWAVEQDRPRLADYFAAVFPAFWRRELDVEDVSVVVECLEKAGIDSTGFETFQAGSGRETHDKLVNGLHEAGIYGVPTYVFGEHVLFGREHLPFVRWYLQGANGSAPDIAYEVG